MNVVADAVHGIRVVEAPRDTAVLVVLVVDDAGDPSTRSSCPSWRVAGRSGTAKSDSRGRAVFHLATAGAVSVRASADGFVPATRARSP